MIFIKKIYQNIYENFVLIKYLLKYLKFYSIDIEKFEIIYKTCYAFLHYNFFVLIIFGLIFL